MMRYVTTAIVGAILASAWGLHSARAQSPSPMTAAKTVPTDKSAKPSIPRFRQLSPYATARERLLSTGWQPAASPDADKCMEDDARCQGRPEMEACAGTGKANCLFLWRKGDVTVAVSTVYDPPVI